MEGNEEYVPCDSPMDAQAYVRSRLIDADDEDDVSLHLACLAGDHVALEWLLKEEGRQEWLDFRVRPFNSSPLRIAATGGSTYCVPLLLNAGAAIDLEDIKGQTPLFVATSIRNLAIMEELLKRGANPEGSILNRGTPLLIAVRDGFAMGVKLLLRYGANPEPFNQLVSCVVPGWPLQHAVVYSHFSCFLALVQSGAAPNLAGLFAGVTPALLRRLSIPHAILKYARDKPEFVHLYHDCGGHLAQVDHEDPLCEEPSEVRDQIFNLQRIPRSLKCICRPHVLRAVGKNFKEISSLEVPTCLHSFLRFEEYAFSAVKTKQNTHVRIMNNEE